MFKKEYLYLTFDSTTDAIAAEAQFKAANIKGRLVIIPRELSAGCGMSWRSEPHLKEDLLTVASENSINLKQVEVL
ncbi:DUF3343 domain-containing protein [Facklamia sp. 7083-14-GEN3]|uniref:DUF3343 domain-containing protein n=1 Tax=Facklamia sp. 7083-14-GEN3 TaxID=2973478 RepID=UPI00215C23E8|nr:DUF3343 domain-containing protein [Facklamia sp. 7083-14-GEN3]MCR8968601.1 DUF3343 domain-containing protein [Facklamia sp. 7083-14-GEN3]